MSEATPVNYEQAYEEILHLLDSFHHWPDAEPAKALNLCLELLSEHIAWAHEEKDGLCATCEVEGCIYREGGRESCPAKDDAE